VSTAAAADGSGYGYGPNGGDGYGYDPYGDDPYGTGDGAGRPSTTTGGAVIAGVVQGGPADDAGLAEGDTITAVDGHAVASPDALTELLGKQRPGDRVEVATVDQNGTAGTIAVTLGSGPAK
jgi:S1-C subfamily serine protease